MAEIKPWKVGSSYEDVNHSTITSVKNIFEDQIFVAVEDAVKGCADAEEQNEGRSVDGSHP